ncbi:acyl-CoA dehydrogenase NM domain-like protein [Lichtheimia hyalospora FSU 10163]|nr:acyl-CoA dehydrogenase NM domain-like protein [Lichtheimia hyalospora FSU 10163]
MKTYTVEEVAQHNKADDIWIIIDGKVFDVTKFVNEHPGGKKVLVKMAGKDASKKFKQFHNAAIMQKVGLPMQIGVIAGAGDAAPAPAPAAAAPKKTTPATLTHPQQLVMADGAVFGEGIPYGDPTWYQEWNSPYYNESHIRLRKIVREFVDKELMPYTHEWSEAKAIPREVVKKVGQMGLLAAACGAGTNPQIAGNKALNPYGLPGVKPEEFDIFHEFICIDELSRTGAGTIIWGLQGGLSIALPPVMNFARDEVRNKVVPGCLSGEKFIALAITEPYAGSDVANLQTTAKDMGDHFLLNGEKKWITQGSYGDYYTVACRTGGPGMGGISLLLVEREFPGVTARPMDVSGMWGSGTSYITFEDVKVPKTHLIGEVNKGFKYIMHNFNHERLGIVMQANRYARACIEEAFAYSLKRKTFGVRLIDHPVIRNKFGHMIRQVEATHAWLESILYQVKTLPAETQPARLGGPVALLKAQATQTFEYCAREAGQVFGGLAYTRGGQAERVERGTREVRAFTVPGGSEEIMLDLGVRQALKNYEKKNKL